MTNQKPSEDHTDQTSINTIHKTPLDHNYRLLAIYTITLIFIFKHIMYTIQKCYL